MFVAYGTDAPVKNRPYATGALIVLNVISFCCMLIGGDVIVEDHSLAYGSVYPTQWFTSLFLHASFLHLVVNMVFLWPFGLIIEGKIGWYKFLGLYLGIGIFQRAAEQILTVMLPMVDDSLITMGSSPIVHALMGITVVVSIKSSLDCILFYGFGSVTFPLKMLFVIIFFLLLDLATIVLYQSPNNWTHISGVLIGFAVGFTALLRGWVDCKGLDIISAVTGKTFHKPLTEEERKIREKRLASEEQHHLEEIENTHKFIDSLISHDEFEAAYKRNEQLHREHPGMAWKKESLYKMLKGLACQKKDELYLLAFREHLEHFTEPALSALHLFAAAAEIRGKRPLAAIRHLDLIDEQHVTEKLNSMSQTVREKAKEQIDAGFMEVSGD